MVSEGNLPSGRLPIKMSPSLRPWFSTNAFVASVVDKQTKETSSRADRGNALIQLLMQLYSALCVVGVLLLETICYLAEYKKYVEQTVVYDPDSRMLVGIMRDITDEESEREKKARLNKQTVEVADTVVEKQMRIVQEIASLLGETAAETKIALTKLKESIGDE